MSAAPSLLLLLLLCLSALVAAGAGDSENDCPPKRQRKVGSCHDGVQRYVTEYFEYSRLKGRCVKKLRAKQASCDSREDSDSATKDKPCPRLRVMESAPCKNGQQRVMIEHHEFDQKLGRCAPRKDVVVKKCQELKIRKSSALAACPETQVFQDGCRSSGYRTVTTVYYAAVKALGRCVKKVKQEEEKCAWLLKHKTCPADETEESGPCIKGYRTSVTSWYERDAEGRCQRRSKRATVTCAGKSHECPPKRVTKVGKCQDRVQRWLTVYYEFSQLKVRCLRKFRTKELPCSKGQSDSDDSATGSAHKAKPCPRLRVMESAPCKNGQQRVMIEHHEFDQKLGRCAPRKDVVVKKCHELKRKSSALAACPETQVFQDGCRSSGYRTVTTVYYAAVKALGRCVKKVKQEEEKCAWLLKKKTCPPDATAETGSCSKGGFRTNIIFRYRRNAEGRCVRRKRTVTVVCGNKAAALCPPRSRKKLGQCKGGVERWLTTYHVYSKLRGRCIRKLLLKEVPCRLTKHACPTPRIVEPGPCKKNGTRRVLIKHFELADQEGSSAGVSGGVKCVSRTDHVEKKCRKQPRRRHECPDPVYHQQVCRADYRSVVKTHYQWSGLRGRCVKRVELATEPCAAASGIHGCPGDEVVETGLCDKSGYRSDIVFRHVRGSAGSCRVIEVHVTKKCAGGAKPKCKPLSRKLVQPCTSSGVEKWLTTYYVYNSHTKRCVRKIRYKEIACQRKSGCPTARVVEPAGTCRHGKQQVLIVHHELESDDSGGSKCQRHKDFVHRACGKQASRRKSLAARHHCRDSVYHQKPCRSSGYRTVVKFYYRYNGATGRCVRNVQVAEEKCGRLLHVTLRNGCRADETVETGPCRRGFRQDIVYRYARSKSGSCVRQERRVTVTCAVSVNAKPDLTLS